jgi:allantoin racemase
MYRALAPRLMPAILPMPARPDSPVNDIMKIKIINPNTTQSMTEKIGQCARAVAHGDTRIVAVSPRMGPASIEATMTRR